MRLRLRSAAEADIATALSWYDRQRPGLGLRFFEALQTTLSRIEDHPELHPRVYRETRRALFPRPFPYLILYRLEGEHITVYAVLHQARDPELWERRSR